MFWIFKGGKNGLDDEGRTYNEALIDHIKWCMDTLCRTNSQSDFDSFTKNALTYASIGDNFDFTMKHNAKNELIDHYHKFIKALGDQDGPKWKKIITKFLEKYFDEPIEEILKEPPTLMEDNHKWQWMPITKPKF